MTTFNYGNGVTASFGYSDDRLQLTSLAYNKSSQDLLGLSYYYKSDSTNCPNAPSGNNGQIQCIKDNSNTTLTPGAGGRSATHTYDALSRLSTAVTSGSTQYPAWGLSWTYDRYGNRTNQTQTAGSPPMNSVAISATTNRLTDPGYAYDANGNMTNDGLNQLGYDAENHMVSAAGAAYSYDGGGLRVKKVSGGTTTVYIFSGAKVIAEYASGSLSKEYIYSGGQLIAMHAGGTLKYQMADHLSLRLTADTSGSIAAQSGHYPHGENWYETGGTNKLKFTTYERDTGVNESGNDYAMMRTHISRLGRFNSPDPVAGVLTISSVEPALESKVCRNN